MSTNYAMFLCSPLGEKTINSLSKRKKELTISDKIEKFFTPDVRFELIPKTGCYNVLGLTDAGKLFVTKISGIKMEKGKMIATSLIEPIYEYALKLELCTERIDGDEN